MIKHLHIHTQINGHGGIPRFNRNLIQAIPNASEISLNDHAPKGVSKNKFHFVFSIIRLLKKTKPETVIIGHLNFTPLALIIKILSKSKTIVILHGVEAWQVRKKLKLFYRFVDEFWAVSTYTANTFGKTNGVPISVIKPIFNTLPANWKLSIGDYKPFFLTVTRLDTVEGYKGVEQTLHVIAQLKSEMHHVGFKYKLVVHGNDVQRHKELVETLDISSLVDFEANLTDLELKKLYHDCSFFSLPSTGEGFGIVFLEAMSCGKPCIGCFNTGAEDVIVHGETGYLLSQQMEEMLPHFKKLILDTIECKRLGINGLHRLKEHFVFQKFERRISELIKS